MFQHFEKNSANEVSLPLFYPNKSSIDMRNANLWREATKCPHLLICKKREEMNKKALVSSDRNIYYAFKMC